MYSKNYPEKTPNSRLIENIFQYNKDDVRKTTADTIFNGKKLKACPLGSVAKQACPLSLPVFNIFLGSPSHSNQRRKANKIELERKR